jgi:hypothetical protein
LWLSISLLAWLRNVKGSSASKTCVSSCSIVFN